MEYVTFTDEMLKLLKKIKGKELEAIYWAQMRDGMEKFPNFTIGNLFLGIGGEYLEIEEKIRRELPLRTRPVS